MDAFETVIAAILDRRGYWTRTGVKVQLTKPEKRKIGRHSTPRWELDVVGYSAAKNELLVVECKSFLDSRGVLVSAFDGSDPAAAKRYKLFSEPVLRRVVLGRLVSQMVKAGLSARKPSIKLGLAAGNVHGDEEWLAAHFESHGWLFLGPSDIRAALALLADEGYENTVHTVVTKILIRT